MKIIAFYLPQFHEIPENNQWWGDGFTEWTNTKKSKPLFSNHYQPREPLNDYYYNLLEDDVKKWQVELAIKYGINGFCFYHYWFKNGKKLLEKPVEQFLKNTELKINFCMSWANEPWSRRWDGSEHKIIMSQEYGMESEWEKHFYYLLPFFKDNRYIKFNDKPLLLIYRPDIIPCLNEMLDFWQKLAFKNGLNGISFGSQHPNFQYENRIENEKFDISVEFEPLFTANRINITNTRIDKLISELSNNAKNLQNYIIIIKKIINSILEMIFSKKLKFRFKYLTILNYDDIVNNSLTNKPLYKNSVPGVFTGWDNSPRKGRNAIIFKGSTPQKFKEYLKLQMKRAKEVYNQEMIFINAWNEWAEGAYLEPDKKYGYAYLEAVKEAVFENGEFDAK